MLPSITMVIREDPLKTHRAVEALRIALGLSTGGNALTVVLLGRAPLLLTDDLEQVLDGEILEKHLPALKELGLPFVVVPGARSQFTLDPAFQVREAPLPEIASLLANADRVLSF